MRKTATEWKAYYSDPKFEQQYTYEDMTWVQPARRMELPSSVEPGCRDGECPLLPGW